MVAITGWAHVELTVRDLDRSEAWYRDMLGFRTVWEGRNDEGGYFARAIMDPESKVVIGLTQHKSGSRAPFDQLRTGLDHISFAVASREELEAWHAHLVGLTLTPSEIEVQTFGASSFTVRDPDGMPVEFTATKGT